MLPFFISHWLMMIKYMKLIYGMTGTSIGSFTKDMIIKG